MHCPYCSDPETKVLETRMVEDGLRRRRECQKCSNRFTTYERALFNLQVLKKDGSKEAFDLEKIRSSITKALGRPQVDLIDMLSKRIEQKVLNKHRNPLKTTLIGKLILTELKRHDKMAYLRFASIHKAIEDPKALSKELQSLA